MTKQTIFYPVNNLLSIFPLDFADFEFLRPVDEQTPKDGADHGRGGGSSDSQQRALGRSAARNGKYYFDEEQRDQVESSIKELLDCWREEIC